MSASAPPCSGSADDRIRPKQHAAPRQPGDGGRIARLDGCNARIAGRSARSGRAAGIRYRAAGTSRLYRRCFACGRRGWQKVYWAGGVPGAAPASTGFVVRLVLGLVFGILLATALILLVIFKLTGLI